jgi:hypothetical protein
MGLFRSQYDTQKEERVLTVELGCNPDFFSRNTTILNTPSYFGFVTVGKLPLNQYL